MPQDQNSLPVIANISSDPGTTKAYQVTDLLDNIDEDSIAGCDHIFLCCDLSRYDIKTYITSPWREILSPWREILKEKSILTPLKSNIEALKQFVDIAIDVQLVRVPLTQQIKLPQKTGVLGLGKIYKSIDSRERTFDGNKLMPLPEAPEDRVQLEKREPRQPNAYTYTGKSLRYRLGATRRHFLALVYDLISPKDREYPDSSFQSGQVNEDGLGVEDQAEIALPGITYSFITEHLDETSGWNELVSAFCAAFRNNGGVNLVVYLRGDRREACAADFNHVLHTLGPLDCNVYLLQGDMSEREFSQLIAETHFYVGTSLRFSLQPDLIAFACAGKPTISLPNCLDGKVNQHLISLPVAYTKELSYPDRSPSIKYTTHALRMNWESLFNLFTESFRLAKNDQAYSELCRKLDTNLKNLFCAGNGAIGAAEMPQAFTTMHQVPGL